ncbi:HNH endonuclease [Gluconobacter cadivus]|uniref:HNH endonuclease n=1 Tax=Gluconobacter cadivus TaxID=2728101 RepID=UPI002241005C|nr:HNH endonuclease [Gluconobacter cadivus]
MLENPPSEEHVFPLAIGGTVTTDRVCKTCNSTLGSRVDAALSNFFPIKMRRAKLNLAGNSGSVPVWYEMFLGKAQLIGQTADQVHITFDKERGQLDTRQLKHVIESVMPDGKKGLQITLDKRDQDQIPKIINRERRRHGLPPLPEQEIASHIENLTINKVEKPIIKINHSIDFAFIRHSILKIAYELAFIWLGESYLDDPIATELRTSIYSPELTATDNIKGYVGPAEYCNAFKNWLPHEDHHLAYAYIAEGNVFVSVRVFDIWGASIVVSCNSDKYFKLPIDNKKLRFLVIDAANRKTIETSFEEEIQRLVASMCALKRLPPFEDPL